MLLSHVNRSHTHTHTYTYTTSHLMTPTHSFIPHPSFYLPTLIAPRSLPTPSGPDGQLGYSWTVTFLENSKLTFSGSQLLFNYATTYLTGTHVDLYVNKLKSANGLVPIGGYFALTFRGMRTSYLACDSTARAVADALRGLDSIGDVAVVRTVAPDTNNGYTWTVTFLTELGALDLMMFDGADLTGTAATGVVAEYQRGVAPPFNSLDPSRTLPLGMQAITDMTNPYLEIGNLDQGIAYYFRVAAVNAAGFQGPFAFAPNLYAVPQLQLPSPPSLPGLTVVGGSTMQVSFGASVAAGGADVNLYKVEYANRAFALLHSVPSYHSLYPQNTPHALPSPLNTLQGGVREPCLRSRGARGGRAVCGAQ